MSDNLYKNLVSNASKNIETLNDLKNLAVKVGAFELGAECRRLEKELFPETEEETKARARVEELDLALRMVGVKFSDKKLYYIIEETLKVFSKKKGKFDLMDASKIQVKADGLFAR